MELRPVLFRVQTGRRRNQNHGAGAVSGGCFDGSSLPGISCVRPQALLESAWDLTPGEPLTVSVRFTAAAAPYIKEREWTRNQTITLNSDGSLVLKFKASGRRDIKSWVLSFGAAAELLEPGDLRREIADELQSLVRFYASDPEK